MLYRALMVSVALILLSMVTASAAVIHPANRHPVSKVSGKAIKKPRVQQHYSFIPPAKPIPELDQLKTHLSTPMVASPPQPLPAPLVKPIVTIPAQVQPIAAQVTYHPSHPTTDNPLSSLWALFFRSSTGTKERSWVMGISQTQAEVLAAHIAAFMPSQLPPQTTTLLLAPTERGQQQNPLTPALEIALRQAGYALVASKSKAPQALVFQYQVSPLDNGLFLQLRFNQTVVTRYYPLNAENTVVAHTPFTIRQGGH